MSRTIDHKIHDRVDDASWDRAEDTIALRLYIDVVWQRRAAIGLVVATTAVLFVVGTLVALLILPTERTASLQFRVLVLEADPAQVTAAPVLAEVYRASALQRFGTYDDFKESLLLLPSSPTMDFLNYEYQAKLADTRLTPVDRARLEDEFRRKREAIQDRVFSLTMRRRERASRLPAALAEKILRDTLAVWARHMDERMVATQDPFPSLSTNILRWDEIQREDYLPAVDILRAKTRRVIDAIDALSTVPGAEAVRAGKHAISLAEVRAALQDTMRFTLEPLLDLIRAERATKNARELPMYVRNQLFQRRLESDRSENLLALLQQSLASYTTHGAARPSDARQRPEATSPPEESFLDQVMGLSTAEADGTYRKALTDKILAESERAGKAKQEMALYEDIAKRINAQSSADAEMRSPIEARIADAFTQITRPVEQLELLYREIDAQNLQPSTTLYTLTGPFTTITTSPLNVRTLSLWFIVTMLLTIILGSIGAILHHAYQSSLASKPGPAGARLQ